MCLACQMEGEWLAYLEQVAQQELALQQSQQNAAPAADAAAAKPSAAPAPASPFVCEELPSE